MKHLTIIGGSGFVGKSFIDSFNRGLLKKYSINSITIICRKKIFQKNDNLNYSNIKIIYGDIGKMKVLPKTDFYIYASEATKTSEYKNIRKITKQHKQSINNFCKLIKKYPNSKLLYLSSGAVERKSHIRSYKNTYSSLKLYSEGKIKLLKTNKIHTSIARCFTFIGRWLPINKHYAVENFLRDAKYKKKIRIKSKKLVYRSYMYADDMVDWLSKILIKSKKTTKIYNVGSEQEIEIRKLASLIASFYKEKITIISKDINSNHIDRYVPNISKTKNDFKVKINYNLAKSIQLTLKSI